MSVLEVTDVGKTFESRGRPVHALRRINLEVQEQEFMTIVGPSGCGKSTLMNILAGLLRPSLGEVRLRGTPLDGPNLSIGYVTQRDTLLPWRTLLQNVEFVQEVRGVDEETRHGRARELIEQVELAGFEDHFPHELSGGMRQRAMIIRSLAYDPDVLLLDEPFGALDAQTRGMLQNQLQDLHLATGKTMIFITHDLHEAVALADRVVVLSPPPGIVKAVHRLDLPRPRDVFSIHNDDQFRVVYDEVTEEVLTEVRNANAPSGNGHSAHRRKAGSAARVMTSEAEGTPPRTHSDATRAIESTLEGEDEDEDDVTPTARRSSMRSRMRWMGMHVLFMVAVLALWELASGTIIDPFWVSQPTAILAELWAMVSDSSFWGHIGTTLYEVFLGFTVGAVVGMGLAFLLSEFPKAANFFDPYLAAGYGIPKSALAPLFIVWFGIGVMSKVMMAAAAVFFLVFFNTMAGLRSVDRDLLNLAQVAGASRTQTMKKVKFPSAFPYLITGIKVALPMGLVVVIVAEFISSSRGIGYLILRASNFFNTAQVFAGVLVLALVVVLFNALLARLEAFGLRWRPPRSD